jgi:hypothetical protein
VANIQEMLMQLITSLGGGNKESGGVPGVEQRVMEEVMKTINNSQQENDFGSGSDQYDRYVDRQHASKVYNNEPMTMYNWEDGGFDMAKKEPEILAELLQNLNFNINGWNRENPLER